MNGEKGKAIEIWKQAYAMRTSEGSMEKYDGLEKLKQKIESGEYVE